eukprot:SAG25_NODE_371_length_9000_cov_6.528480_10_plen_79_part_00
MRPRAAGTGVLPVRSDREHTNAYPLGLADGPPSIRSDGLVCSWPARPPPPPHAHAWLAAWCMAAAGSWQQLAGEGETA